MSSTRSSGGSINCTVRRGRARNSRENVMDRRPVGSRRDVVTEPRSRPWNIMSRPASPIPIGVDPLSASSRRWTPQNRSRSRADSGC